ncbi:DUF2284 domain-containing protein [Chloroflexota bacterium]
MVRKILEKVPDELLQQDLERYVQMALQLGAADAIIITANMVVIDERVRAKCIVPLCTSYGKSANCPPYAMELDLVRGVVGKFRYAIFSKLEVPAEEIAGPEAREKRSAIPYTRKNSEIVAEIEAEAFRDGYYLTMGFASGSCRSIFCYETDCNALMAGQPCRFPLKARTSMEAVGMDVYAMATKVGWDIYPIGRTTPPQQVPFGVMCGLVLVY